MSQSDGSRSPLFKLWFDSGWRSLRWWVLLSVRPWFLASSWILGLCKGPMCPPLLIPRLKSMRFIWLRDISLRRVRTILLFSSTLAVHTKFGNLTRILSCTAKGHWPFLLRNFIVLVSLVTGLLWVHRGEQPEHNNRHYSRLRSHHLSHILSLPHLRLVHGPLPSTCLGLLPDMLPVGISPCTSKVQVARLGLVQEVASGPCLPVLPTEMQHLRRPGCAHLLMGFPPRSR
jgi:hypothetical protein